MKIAHRCYYPNWLFSKFYWSANIFRFKKIQTFVGSLAATDTASAYSDGDVLVELGTLNSDHPDELVTATKFFIHKAVVGITTACGQTLAGSLQLSATSGTATNAAVSSGTEIVGAGVAWLFHQLYLLLYL